MGSWGTLSLLDHIMSGISFRTIFDNYSCYHVHLPNAITRNLQFSEIWGMMKNE